VTLSSLSWRDSSWRAGIQFSSREEARAQLASRLSTLQSFVSQLRVEDLLPDSVFFPRYEHVQVPWPYPQEVSLLPKRVRLNPLAVLLRTDGLPVTSSQEEEEEEEEHGSEEASEEEDEEEGMNPSTAAKFVLHLSFGNEDLQSQVRVEFTVLIKLIRSTCIGTNFG
jgi:hypothetical protein